MSEQPGSAGPPGVATAPVREPEPRVSLRLAVLTVVGAVIGALLVVGGVVWVSTPRLSSGPDADPPPPPDVRAATRVVYDQGTRQVVVNEVRLTLPAAPYVCAEDQGEPLFSSFVTCNVLIHENYNAHGDDWYASFGVGVATPAYSTPNDPADTARQVFEAARAGFYTGEKTTVDKLTRQRIQLGRPAASQFGNIGYAISGLDSRYDRLLVGTVQLSNGDFAVLVSSRPDDTPAATLRVLDAALATLSAG